MTHTLDQLVECLRGRRVVVLAGAGCSTRSGIPDYRGEGTRARARNPIKGQQYLGEPATRRRYWARSVVGWPRFSAAEPNACHRAIADLEQLGISPGLITQNVDRLHQRGGSQRVVELHGALHEVRCLDCGAMEDRAHLQARLAELNPGWGGDAAALAPDGDADLEGEAIDRFRVAPCQVCGGTLKPNVVFFGETVPKPVVEDAWSLMDEGDALLVVGSSLTVFSGYRFVRNAKKRGWPVGIVNLGPTRADPLIDARVDADVVEAMPQLVSALR